LQEPHDNFFGLILPDGVILAFIVLCAQLLTSIHILSTKDQVRSAIAWIGLVWLAPVFGLFAYFLFGISRIRRRAKLAREKRGLPPRTGALAEPDGNCLADVCADNVSYRWLAHDRLAGRLTGMPVTVDNTVVPLRGGRQAYDAMIRAIEAAKYSIALTTYIFQADQAGRRFIKALVRAKERGVEVRVLVDAVGNLYGLKPVSNLLRRHDIPVGVFNPAKLSWRLAFFNLRTHRKLLVVDGIHGFAGGMNIRKHHLERSDGSPIVQDTHFSITGPIVHQMMDTFADDWVFTTGEVLKGRTWFGSLDNVGAVSGSKIVARAIADGPDEPRQKSAMIIESALGAAKESIKIITPYFLPDEALLAALEQAALKGVKVEILLPEKSNLPLFSLAALAALKPLIRSGCQIFVGKPPFDHTKLMVVDNNWVMLGSSNWDARSLKLNFEFNIECYDKVFASHMCDWALQKFAQSKPVTIAVLNKRNFIKRLFGRILWLGTPYL
jgi:cardiolipin synthase